MATAVDTVLNIAVPGPFRESLNSLGFEVYPLKVHFSSLEVLYESHIRVVLKIVVYFSLFGAQWNLFTWCLNYYPINVMDSIIIYHYIIHFLSYCIRV